MTRNFKECTEFVEVTDEYYRYKPSGLVATLDGIRRTRKGRDEGDYSAKYIVTFADRIQQTEVYSVDFLNGNWEPISREEYLFAQDAVPNQANTP